MLVPKRDQLHWDYFDVSSDPVAAARCEVPTSADEALRRLGFERLGWTLAKLRLNGMELVHEIWKSSDDRCLAELNFTGRPELVTLFEDGTIIKTISKPDVWEWLQMRAGMRNHRADRFAFEAVRGPLTAVLARHRVRVAELERASPVVPSTSMQSHFATRLRAAELRDSRMYAHLVIAMALAFAVAIVAVFPFIAIGLGHHRTFDGHPHPVKIGHLIAAMLLSFIVLIPAHYLAKVFVAPAIVRLRPGPKARPAAELLEIASHVPQGRVWRY